MATAVPAWHRIPRRVVACVLGAACLLALYLAPAAGAAQFPVTGTVYAVAPDGAGGYYAGGSFTVQSSTIVNAAHINSSGTLDPAWHPNPTGTVRALAVSGSNVYLGGNFSISTISNAARVSTAGTLDTGWHPGPSGTVYALALSGSNLYLGGNFTITGTSTVSNAARVATDASGTLDSSWSPSPTGTVYALAVSGSNVYLGGSFTITDGTNTLSNAARVGQTGTLDPGWNPNPQGSQGNPSGTVEALLVSGSTVYLGGQFATVTGQDIVTTNGRPGSVAGPRNSSAPVARPYAAAVDTNNGYDRHWTPSPNAIVHALAATTSTVYLGGDFTAINGSAHTYAAAVDPASGSDTGWNGGASQPVYALALAGSTVYWGGTSAASSLLGAQHTLTLSEPGSGSGTVTSSPGSINCGVTCGQSFDNGTSVTLTAAPSAGSAFTGWSGGGCSGTGTCTVTMNADTAVSANFVLLHSLSVSTGGAGAGAVTSSPGSINCGATCSQNFNAGTQVTLSATASAGSRFAGWLGGGCTGSGSCTVTMSGDTTVSATFVAQHGLSVTDTGSGSGSVTSDIGGINCTPNCSQSFDLGTTVTLSASPATGSTFSGWSGGGCSGTGSCSVTLDGDTSVSATFTAQPRLLTVTTAGPGSVTSSPDGINCGASCSQNYNYGTSVSLTASPAAGSRFAGWSGGGCSGTGSCSVALNADTTVTANFIAQHTLTVVDGGSGSGTVSSSPGSIQCGSSCSQSYDAGSTVTLTPNPDHRSKFNGWFGGGCTGTGSCTVTLSGDLTVAAGFSKRVAPKCTLRPQSGAVLLSKPKRGKPGKQGTLAITVHCDQSADVTLTGVVTELVGKKPRHGKQQVKRFKLGPVHASVSASTDKVLMLALPQGLLKDLKRKAKPSALLTLSATSPDGTSRVTATIKTLTGA